MMTYNDTTYCTGDGCSNFTNCSRALTPAVRAKAKIWWGGDDVPIAFFESPKDLDCYAQESTEQTTTGESPKQD